MLRKTARTLGAIIVAFLLSGLLAACNLAPPPAPVKKTEKVKKLPIEKIKAVEPPTNWPVEVPLYPQAELESVLPVGAGFKLILKTEDTAAQIFNWYYDELEVRKWQMSGPTLDVAQNIAIIDGKLGDKSLFLEARTSEDEDGRTSLHLTAEQPQPVQ